MFGWTLWIYLPNLKFVALSVPEIIWGTQKIWAVPVNAHAPFSPKFLRGFCSHGPLNISAKFDVRSFTHSWANRGYFKKLGSPWSRPRSLFSQIFKEILFAWTLWIHPPSLKFVALPVPEIIGGTPKIWTVSGYAHVPFSPKLLKAFCFDGSFEYTCQIWSS